MIVAALETKGVIQPEQWHTLPRPQKQTLIDAIAMHTKALVGNNRCCSPQTFTGFLKAEVTPKKIRGYAKLIADAVHKTLSESYDDDKLVSSSQSVSLVRTDSSLNDSSQLRTPLMG